MKRRLVCFCAALALCVLALVSSTPLTRTVKADPPTELCEACLRRTQKHFEHCQSLYGESELRCYDEFNEDIIHCYAHFCEQ